MLVVPVFNEAQNLRNFYSAVCKVVEGLPRYAWGFLFVNDGSRDNTLEVLTELAGKDQRIKALSLSRNFGKEIALTAGAEAVGDEDAVIFMDADLQHPPELIRQLVGKWEQGFHIVATERTAIHYSTLREMGSRLFYHVINRYSDLTIQPKATDFRLLDRAVLDVLKTFEERTRFFRGLIDWMGFSKTYVTFEAPNREAGQSTFSLRTLAGLAVNSFTSFSLLPLRFTGYFGLMVLLLAGVILFYMLVSQFFMGQVYTPLAYFVVFNTLLFGVVLAALGFIALYIGHIHTEVVRRPLYIVQERIGFGTGQVQCDRTK